MLYNVPSDFYFRIHHVRPRFKSNVESVLMYFADQVSSIGVQPRDEFKFRINNSIKNFPGNGNKKEKTINNWRTEISSLFGFFYEKNKHIYPGTIAKLLSRDNDLSEMFRHFLFKFQYPGAHIKNRDVCEQINNHIKFIPAKTILKVLIESNNDPDKSNRYVTTEEVAWCIYNDKRVTSFNHEPYEDTWNRIKVNRDNRISYDTTGDKIRYAKDILDYMEIANLLSKYGNKYYLNLVENEIIEKFLSNKENFNGYDDFIKRGHASLEEVNDKRISWFEYVNDLHLDFRTNVLKYLSDTYDKYKKAQKQMDLIIKNISKENGFYHNTKEIGDQGEGIVYKYETDFIRSHNRYDLEHLIKFIPTPLSVGYDFNSIEPSNDELRRYIEVKSTISASELMVNTFHMTPNEVRTAKTVGKHYFVYRLKILRNQRPTMIKIKDPFKLILEGILSISNDIDDFKSGWDITINNIKYFQEIVI